MRTLFILLPLLEAGLILFLVLRKPSEKRPSTALAVVGLVAIGAGIVWILRSHLNYGWLGPLWFIRIWQTAFGHQGDTSFWGLLNPHLYAGVFALVLIAGGAGLLRIRSWARSLFLYAAVAAAVLAMIMFIKFRSSMDNALRMGTFLYILAALVVVIFFMQKPIMQMFSEEVAEADSPQEDRT